MTGGRGAGFRFQRVSSFRFQEVSGDFRGFQVSGFRRFQRVSGFRFQEVSEGFRFKVSGFRRFQVSGVGVIAMLG